MYNRILNCQVDSMDSRGSDIAVKMLGGLGLLSIGAIIAVATGSARPTVTSQKVVTPTPSIAAATSSSTYDKAIADLDLANAQLDALKKEIDSLDTTLGTQKDLDDATNQLDSIN